MIDPKQDLHIVVTLRMMTVITLGITAEEARDDAKLRAAAVGVLDSDLRHGVRTADDLIDTVTIIDVHDENDDPMPTRWGIFEEGTGYRLNVGTFDDRESAASYASECVTSDWEALPVLDD